MTRDSTSAQIASVRRCAIDMLSTTSMASCALFALCCMIATANSALLFEQHSALAESSTLAAGPQSKSECLYREMGALHQKRVRVQTDPVRRVPAAAHHHRILNTFTPMNGTTKEKPTYCSSLPNEASKAFTTAAIVPGAKSSSRLFTNTKTGSALFFPRISRSRKAFRTSSLDSRTSA
jgi:hypothetical protein